MSRSGGTSPSTTITRATGSVIAKRMPSFMSCHAETARVSGRARRRRGDRERGEARRRGKAAAWIAKFDAAPTDAIRKPATPGPTARVTLNAMLLSATACAASVRGTLLKTSVLRSVRSNTALTPDRRENSEEMPDLNRIEREQHGERERDDDHQRTELAASA